MLSQFILEHSTAHDDEVIVTPHTSVSWHQLRDQTLLMVAAGESLRKRRVGLCLGSSSQSYAVLAALDKLNCDSFLFDERLAMEEVIRLASNLRLGAVVQPQKRNNGSALEIREIEGEENASGNSTVTILTSGTSGQPKAATHSWESLGRPIRRGTNQSASRWLMTYRPNLYAGLQVMLQCFADRGTLACPDSEMEPGSVVQFMANSRVQFVSATPSFWRRLLMFADAEALRNIPLVQVTLGGEVIDQPLLDRLKKIFPHARLVHIYATTELGRCFSVSDGLAGFPVSYLRQPLPDGVSLKVKEGELLVQSPNSMRNYDRYSSCQRSGCDWFHTGDLVEIQDDRAYFVGRKSDLINVAGSKVYPIEVERVIRVIPGIADVRVFGKTSSIAGEVVACEIVPAPNQDPEALKEVVIRNCRSELSSHQQPRMIRLVTQLNLSSAGKTLRTKAL